MVQAQQAAHMRLQQLQLQSQSQMHADGSAQPLGSPTNSLCINIALSPPAAAGTPVSRVISPLAAVKLAPPSSLHLPSLTLTGALQSTSPPNGRILSPPLPTVAIAHSAFKAVVRRPDAITLPLPVSLQSRTAAVAPAPPTCTATPSPTSSVTVTSAVTPPSAGTTTIVTPNGVPLHLHI